MVECYFALLEATLYPYYNIGAKEVLIMFQENLKALRK